MGILSFISSIFKPAADLVDNLHTSTEEKLELKNEFERIQNEMTERELQAAELVANLRMKLAETASKTAVAETQSDSAFTKMYRPLILTGMFILICLNSFGLLENPIPPIFVQVFGAAFGVVGIGRSVEKVIRRK